MSYHFYFYYYNHLLYHFIFIYLYSKTNGKVEIPTWLPLYILSLSSQMWHLLCHLSNTSRIATSQCACPQTASQRLDGKAFHPEQPFHSCWLPWLGIHWLLLQEISSDFSGMRIGWHNQHSPPPWSAELDLNSSPWGFLSSKLGLLKTTPSLSKFSLALLDLFGLWVESVDRLSFCFKFHIHLHLNLAHQCFCPLFGPYQSWMFIFNYIAALTSLTAKYFRHYSFFI